LGPFHRRLRYVASRRREVKPRKRAARKLSLEEIATSAVCAEKRRPQDETALVGRNPSSHRPRAERHASTRWNRANPSRALCLAKEKCARALREYVPR